MLSHRYQRRRFRHHSFSEVCLTAVLLCMLSPTAWATQFDVDSPRMNVDPRRDTPIVLSGLENTVFGIADVGRMSARLELELESSVENTSVQIASVGMSHVFVRDHSFERRHPQGGADNLYRDVVAFLCRNDSRNPIIPFSPLPSPTPTANLSVGLNPNIEFATRPDADGENCEPDEMCKTNEMYLTIAFICAPVASNSTSSTIPPPINITLKGSISYTNPRSTHPELGFEEVLFPVLSETVLYVLSGCCIIIILSWIYAKIRQLPPGRTLLTLFAACFSKGLMAGLTFLYFSNVAQDGLRSQWYVYVRVSLSAVADISFISVVISLSSGYRIFPDVWFVDGRSPVLLVYIGVTLQILIVIAVKIMFPFRALSVVAYTIAAGTIGALVIVSSLRNYRFLGRYGKLVERAHIILKTTPIRRMRIFFIVNIAIVGIIYAFKIVSVGVWDFNLRRPDLMWASLEMADAALLVWYVIVVFPRKNSALYLDMSNLSNARLQQAEAWRARQRANQRREANSRTSASTSTIRLRIDDGTEIVYSARQQLSDEEIRSVAESRVDLDPSAESDPQPPWVSWSPLVCLPRPDASTWGSYAPVSRILRRERRFVPVLPSSIVLGSPSESPDTVELTVGVPTTGPNSVPRSYDEKGIEITRNRASLSNGTGSGSTQQAESSENSPAAQEDRDAQSGSLSTLSRMHRVFVRRRSATEGAFDIEDGTSFIDLSASASSSMLHIAEHIDNRLSISSGESCDGEIQTPDSR